MRRFSAPALSALLVIFGAACARDATDREASYASDMAVQAAATITEADYMRRIGVIAHDSMRGRDTPSPELEATAEWIASEFRGMGLEPGGDDGSFIQRYAIETVRADLSASSAEVGGAAALSFGTDLLPGGRPSAGEYSGEVVVVTGLEGDIEAEANRLAGKHVVYVPPVDAGRAAFLVQRQLRTAGAGSVISVFSGGDAEWSEAAAAVESRESIRPGFDEGGRTGSFVLREAALLALLASEGLGLPMVAEELGFLETELTLTLRPAIEVVRSETAPNVVGILPGSDPELADEYVVYSAHMDHVGVGSPNAEGDSIWNGADDDASGTTGVIEIAEAFASMETAPRRSVVFLLVSGEEKGLWGSAYYAENPGPVDGENIVANINADMIGRNWPDTIVAIGKEHSDLGETLNAVNAAHPELNMTAIDDIWPEERFYFRSDHFNFARRGVPVLFFFNGTHEDYHGRDDEVDRIDGDKAARLSQLMFYLGWEVAQRTERPRWDPASREQIVTDPY